MSDPYSAIDAEEAEDELTALAIQRVVDAYGQRLVDEALYGFSAVGPDGQRIDPSRISADQL